MMANPEPGQRWRCALGGEDDAVEILRVTEVTVEYRNLRTLTTLTAMLDVFTVLYEPDATPHRRARGGGS